MSFLDLDEFLFDLAEAVDIVYTPFIDVKEYPEAVDVVLVEGAVANNENLEMIQRVAHRRDVAAHGTVAKGDQDQGIASHSMDHLQILVIGHSALDQDDVDAFGIFLDVDERRIDEVHGRGQVEQKLVEVQKRHVAARAAAEPYGGEPQTSHCFFSRAVTRKESTERSRFISPTVEPWKKMAPVGQA